MPPKPILLAMIICAHSGCTSATESQWAVANLWIEKTGEDIHGFQSWQLFAGPWERTRNKRFHQCSIVFELQGSSNVGCSTCFESWDVQLTMVETDCSDAQVDANEWAGLRNLGLATEIPSFPENAILQDADFGVWASWEWENDWTPYGWTTKTANTELPAEWTDAGPLEISSPWVWDLN